MSDSATPYSALLARLRRISPVLRIAFLMVLLTLSTMGIRNIRQGQIQERIRISQENVAGTALDKIHRQFEALQQAMLNEGERLANSSSFRSLIRTAQEGPDASSDELLAFLSDYPMPAKSSIELYSTEPQLLGWRGFSITLVEAPSAPLHFTTPQYRVIQDGDLRDVLVVWMPIREGLQVLGAIRMMRLIGEKVPVENAYLRNSSLSDDWRRLTGLPVSVRYAPLDPPADPNDPFTNVLTALDGTVLGEVGIEPPSSQTLLDASQNRYDDLMAFWLTLLMAALLTEAWRRYRQSLDVPVLSGLGKPVGWLGALLAGWWALRFMWLALDVPARWQRGKAPFSALFDPTHFATDALFGLFRSMGDMMATAITILVTGILLLGFIGRVKSRYRLRLPAGYSGLQTGIAMGLMVLSGLAVLGLTFLPALAARHVVTDSTLDYFARSGLLPDRLVLFVFGTLVLLAFGVALIQLSVVWSTRLISARLLPFARTTAFIHAAIIVAALAGWTLLWIRSDALVLPSVVLLMFVALSTVLTILICRQPMAGLSLLNVRTTLLLVLIIVAPVYLMMFRGMEDLQRIRMRESIDRFTSGGDPSLIFALEQVVQSARTSDEVRSSLRAPLSRQRRRTALNEAGLLYLQESPLISVGSNDVAITFFDSTGSVAGRYLEGTQTLSEREQDLEDEIELPVLNSMLTGSGSDSVFVTRVTGSQDPEKFEYAGVGRVEDSVGLLGWVMARVIPRNLVYDEATLFPKVLLPITVGSIDDNYSLAEFEDGILQQSLGDDFGQYRLDPEVIEQLKFDQEIWRHETTGESRYLTYYLKRRVNPLDERVLSTLDRVIAARAPHLNLFDHLYFLLRVNLAGLIASIPLYLFSMWVRRRYRDHLQGGARFKDKVLNAFLLVGLLAAGVVGVLGMGVVTAENENAIENWIQQRLERVEQTLALEAEFEETPADVLARSNINALATSVGLDLNVFEDRELILSSREGLVRDRLIDERIPVEAYHRLVHQGEINVFIEQQVGSFTYTAGYRVLNDRDGLPRFIISVPTLPEQERIEEERARTVAYLFGALLMLVVLVMVTASLLANALTGPIARLRGGLEAVAKGRFEQSLPVETGDEIGELVQTFNSMQEQLAESRRQLATQERQLAWREMARQVAHEIKNPLTPMKLSIQHLRRSFSGDEAAVNGDNGRFKGLFDRITGTLIEQIDALARIANEFSSFARLPKRIVEPLDIHTVIREAAALMQEQEGTEVMLNLHTDPLVVEADREELRRIYINLIKNAFEATPEDEEAKVEIATRLAEDDRAVFCSVRDHGTGIPEDARDRIFEPNFSSKTSGTGLGLAIVKKSVEDMQGMIGFETEEGVGTIFWIQVPLLDPPE